MRLRFVLQPGEQFGRLIDNLIISKPLPTSVIIVSAFASRHTLMRLRRPIAAIRERGGLVRVSSESILTEHPRRLCEKFLPGKLMPV